MSYCRYEPCWQSRCKKEREGEFCSTHVGKLCCVCGEQASRECNHTGQFVCGAPLCDNCEGFTDTSKPSGIWGSMNHTHRTRNTQALNQGEKECLIVENY